MQLGFPHCNSGWRADLQKRPASAPGPCPGPWPTAHGPQPTAREQLPSRICKAMHMSAPALPGLLEKKSGCVGEERRGKEELASTHEAARVIISFYPG